MAYYPSLTQVIPLATIRRERILPVAGEVLVNMGARVESTSLVARAEVPGRYHIFNVAQTLGVSPDAAAKYIRVKERQPVRAGHVIAGRRVSLAMVPRVIRTPADGVVAAVGGGRVLLKSVGEPVEVRAHLPGTVSNVMPKMGVLIETVGALVQGVWGIGRESFGVLKVLAKQPGQALRARSIDVACHGAVLVGGSTMDQAALQQALELQVRGIVIGSLDPTLVEAAQEVPFPIIATEGLGQAPMAAPLFNLLRTNDGREAAISGYTQPRWGAIRPEIIIPLPARGASPPAAVGAPLEVGDQVRVIGGPAMGTVGTVRHLPISPWPLETGARVRGAVVAVEKEEEQFVPFFNLELLS
jgi:hypothetical protein